MSLALEALRLVVRPTADVATLREEIGALLRRDPAARDVRVAEARVEVDTDSDELRGVAEALGAFLGAAVARVEADMARRKASHDLRGALAVISGQCEMLEGDLWGPLSEEQRRSIATIGRQVARIDETSERLRPTPRVRPQG